MKLAFIIPYYNHPLKIGKLVKELKKYNYDILIVDDGSDESSKSAIKNLDVEVVTLEKNSGKGAALKKGFKHLLNLGYSHAFQIDADMQHDLICIEDMVKKIKTDNMVCASPIYKNAPKSRYYGRKITNFWLYVNTLGADIKDGMCGMRIYPLSILEDSFCKCKSNRMEFDTEILYYACKTGVKIDWHDVYVDYPEDGVSHFKVFKDNILISIMHAKHFCMLPVYIYKRLFR